MSGATEAITTGWTTRWICRSCRASVGESAMVCTRCGLLLTTPGARIPDDRPSVPPSSAPPSRSPSVRVGGGARAGGRAVEVDDGVAAGSDGRRLCPNPDCRRPLATPNALICLSCMTDVPPLGVVRAAVGPGPVGGAGPAGGGGLAVGAGPGTAGRPMAFIRLEFGGGGVRIDAGDEAVVGRHGTHGSAAVLARYRDVSRRHAVVRVGDDGTVRVRDRSSTNGTFVDGRTIGDGWVELLDGALLRLGVEVSATVRYGRARVRRSGRQW